MNVQEVFSDEFFQQYTQFTEDYDQQQISRHSSSSASLRSLSIGSPECSSFPVTTPNEMFMPTEKSIEHYQLTQYPHLQQFPAQLIDDTDVTRAMVKVISSTFISSYPVMYQQLEHPHIYSQSYNDSNNSSGAFMQYNPALAPKTDFKTGLHGQKLIKMGINLLREINANKIESRPMSNQLHHMISERKRREKLNESFHALRMLLPPGSKKDKVSVLVNAKNYLNSLKEKLYELKDKNQMLEMQLQSVGELKEIRDSSEAVEVKITSRNSPSTSEVEEFSLDIIVRKECDMINLVLEVLECLKNMEGTSLVSVEGNSAPRMNTFSRLNFRLQVKAIDWDKEAFKEGVIRSVQNMLQ